MMRNDAQGFTLVELMFVVVIIGVLAAIAYPAYLDYVMKARRSDAKTVLLDVSQQLERCYSMHNAFNDGDCSVTLPQDSPEGHYRVTGTVNANSYALTATPVSGSPQQNDDDCTTFSINQLNQKTATGSDAANCW